MAGHDRLAIADIFDLGTNVHDDLGVLQAGFPQREFGPLIRRATAGCHRIGPRGAAEKVGVGQRAANRVGVGIAMAKNDERS